MKNFNSFSIILNKKLNVLGKTARISRALIKYRQFTTPRVHYTQNKSPQGHAKESTETNAAYNEVTVA